MPGAGGTRAEADDSLATGQGRPLRTGPTVANGLPPQPNNLSIFWTGCCSLRVGFQMTGVESMAEPWPPVRTWVKRHGASRPIPRRRRASPAAPPYWSRRLPRRRVEPRQRGALRSLPLFNAFRFDDAPGPTYGFVGPQLPTRGTSLPVLPLRRVVLPSRSGEPAHDGPRSCETAGGPP